MSSRPTSGLLRVSLRPAWVLLVRGSNPVWLTHAQAVRLHEPRRACVDKKAARASVSWLSGGFSQRQIMPQALRSCDQPAGWATLARFTLGLAFDTWQCSTGYRARGRALSERQATTPTTVRTAVTSWSLGPPW